MAIIQKIFAYNTGSLISGTTQVGDIAISEANVEYSANYGGLQWWGGPDETNGYVIAHTDPTGGHNGQISTPAYLGFWRSSGLTDSDFLNLCNSIPPRIGFPPFTTTSEAYTWLNDNGYWTSYGASLCDTFTFIGNNATTTSNSAINDGTSGWDSSAYSLETFTGPVSVTFQTSANGNILMGGFSYNPTATPGSTYEDTSYGIYLYNSDQIEIYENGGQVAVLNVGTVVSSSDVWKVDYDGTSVKYYYNSTLLYTSTNAVTQPLHIFFPLFTPNEGAVDICVIGTLSPTPTPTPTLTQTPTPTVTETPSGTPSETPTNTPTPTTTDLSSVTTFTISGCTNLNVLVADLGPSALAPGDVFNFTFTGGTPSGCYRIVEKTVTTPTDGATPLLFYVNCAACEATLVTPTPTTTSTPTPSVTNTPTPTETPGITNTPVASETPTQTPTITPTPSPVPTFFIINNSTGNRTVTNIIGGIGGWNLNTGSYPVSSGQTANGFVHSRLTEPGLDQLVLLFGGTDAINVNITKNGSPYSPSSSPSPTNVTASQINYFINSPSDFIQTNDIIVFTITDYEPTPTPSVTETPSATTTSTPTPTPTSGATGDFTVTVSQVGPDVIWNGSGKFNLGSLSLIGSQTLGSGLQATQAIWAIGPNVTVQQYDGPSFTTFPTSFGTSGSYPAPTSSGSTFGILPGGTGGRLLIVPSGYTSNTVISGTAVYAGTTIAGMNLSGGTYTWAWGSGGSTSSIVMTITP
jgi:hypothetical protein